MPKTSDLLLCYASPSPAASPIYYPSITPENEPINLWCQPSSRLIPFDGLCRVFITIIPTESPIAVATRSKAWTVFARSNPGVMGSTLQIHLQFSFQFRAFQESSANSSRLRSDSSPTRGMDVCVRLFCICVVLCVGSGLATGSSTVQVVLPTVYKIKKLKWNEAFQRCPMLNMEQQEIRMNIFLDYIIRDLSTDVIFGRFTTGESARYPLGRRSGRY
jgi:hypothetical protein